MASSPSARTLLRRALDGRSPDDGPPLVLTAEGVSAAVQEGLVVGRSASAALRLRAPEASRVHAVVVAVPGGWEIEDRSKNGLVRNGRPVHGAAPLQAGDELAIGPVRLRVTATADARSSPADAPGRPAGSARDTEPPTDTEPSTATSGRRAPGASLAGGLLLVATALAALAALA